MLQVQYWINNFVLVYFTIAFFIGFVTTGGNYPLAASLLIACGVFSGMTCFLKLRLVRNYRKEIKELTDELKSFTAESNIGRTTRKMILAYETGGSVFIFLQIITHIIAFPDLRFPYPIYSPFSVDNSQTSRTIYFIILYYAFSISWIIMVFTDTLFLQMANQITYKLDLISGILSNLGHSSHQEKLSQIRMERKGDKNVLKSCIKEHVRLIKLISTLSKILNEAFIYQATNSFAVLLVAIYIISNSTDLISDLLHFSGALFVVLIQVLMTCWAGEFIKTKSEQLHFALYDNHWFKCQHEIQSLLFVMSTFTSKSMVLSGAYVFQLSLATYENFIKQVFSFFTVFYHFLE